MSFYSSPSVPALFFLEYKTCHCVDLNFTLNIQVKSFNADLRPSAAYKVCSIYSRSTSSRQMNSIDSHAGDPSLPRWGPEFATQRGCGIWRLLCNLIGV